MDYRVRGFTRDVNGVKHYIDHEINSIQNFMSEDIKALYHMDGRERLPGKYLPYQDVAEGFSI
ncbi:S-adenosylmethionine decarboxylase proenzyme precursor [Serratia marcescens]|uniref:S-adenosylmethionine decarboxylase proenzyme n=1 Tax=Serratia marcescens TaxID=615 RepID=A0A379YK07_SERMA|nr:S-adenosylmethionine decarboxylase proenzyme precursor [Serratia marcescens]